MPRQVTTTVPTLEELQEALDSIGHSGKIIVKEGSHKDAQVYIISANDNNFNKLLVENFKVAYQKGNSYYSEHLSYSPEKRWSNYVPN